MATTVKIESLPELLIEQPNKLHIQESYLRQIANGSPFTAAKKNKSRVSGSTAKIYRQKGTGRARQGERTNVHFRGGGLAFPPRPRLQNKKMNKFVRRSALRSAVLWHVQAGSAWRIDGSDFAGFAKTKQVASLLETIGTRTVALVVPVHADVMRSSRNISWVKVLTPETLNVRDLIESGSLVFASDALDQYRQILELQNSPEEDVEEVEVEVAPSARAEGKAKAKAKAAAAAGATPAKGNVRKTSAQKSAARKTATETTAANAGADRASGPRAMAAKAAASKPKAPKETGGPEVKGEKAPAPEINKTEEEA